MVAESLGDSRPSCGATRLQIRWLTRLEVSRALTRTSLSRAVEWHSGVFVSTGRNIPASIREVTASMMPVARVVDIIVPWLNVKVIPVPTDFRGVPVKVRRVVIEPSTTTVA